MALVVDPEAAKYDFSRLVTKVVQWHWRLRKNLEFKCSMCYHSCVSLEIAATGGAQITPAMEKAMSNLENLKAFLNVSIILL